MFFPLIIVSISIFHAKVHTKYWCYIFRKICRNLAQKIGAFMTCILVPCVSYTFGKSKSKILARDY